MCKIYFLTPIWRELPSRLNSREQPGAREAHILFYLTNYIISLLNKKQLFYETSLNADKLLRGSKFSLHSYLSFSLLSFSSPPLSFPLSFSLSDIFWTLKVLKWAFTLWFFYRLVTKTNVCFMYKITHHCQRRKSQRSFTVSNKFICYKQFFYSRYKI